MNAPLPAHLTSASKLLSHFHSALGTSTRISYGNECLQLIYAREVSNVSQLLEGLGVSIDCNITLPGAAANEEMIMGSCEGATFMARSTASRIDGPKLEVHIYASSGKDEQRSHQLNALYLMADAIFGTHTSSDGALVGYIARRLVDQRDHVATTEFAANLNDLLAGYLKSTLPTVDPRVHAQR